MSQSRCIDSAKLLRFSYIDESKNRTDHALIFHPRANRIYLHFLSAHVSGTFCAFGAAEVIDIEMIRNGTSDVLKIRSMTWHAMFKRAHRWINTDLRSMIVFAEVQLFCASRSSEYIKRESVHSLICRHRVMKEFCSVKRESL